VTDTRKQLIDSSDNVQQTVGQRRLRCDECCTFWAPQLIVRLVMPNLVLCETCHRAWLENGAPA